VRSRKGTFQSNGNGQADGQRQGRKPCNPSFNLFDPERRADFGQVRRRRRKGCQVEPRIRVLDYDPRIPEPLRSIFSTSAFAPAPAPPVPVQRVYDGMVSAKRLCRRLFAIMHALTHMEHEAKRYALWLAQPKEERRPRRERALRFGWPPGWRSKPTHEVHDILKECHWLVRELPEPDTS
jgi:hypothetical protein